MAIKCPRCGAEYDVTLFTFGRTIRCSCGAEVDLSVGHEQPSGQHQPLKIKAPPAEDEQSREQ